MTSEFDIPDAIRNVLTDEEIANIEARDGWAVGVVELITDGETAETYDPAFIKLFNGDGGAGNFGGVRFMASTDDSDESEPFDEAYAYATEEAGEAQGGDEYYVVTEYHDPEEPDYGEPAP